MTTILALFIFFLLFFAECQAILKRGKLFLLIKARAEIIVLRKFALYLFKGSLCITGGCQKKDGGASSCEQIFIWQLPCFYQIRRLKSIKMFLDFNYFRYVHIFFFNNIFNFIQKSKKLSAAPPA